MTGLTAYGVLGKFTWRMCATVAAQSVLVFFGALVARNLADAQGAAAASSYLLVGSGWPSSRSWPPAHAHAVWRHPRLARPGGDLRSGACRTCHARRRTDLRGRCG